METCISNHKPEKEKANVRLPMGRQSEHTQSTENLTQEGGERIHRKLKRAQVLRQFYERIYIFL